MSYQGGGGSWLDPIFKAIQVRAFIDDLKYKRELRERERQAYTMELDDRRRARATQDFQTAIALHGMGATQTTPGQERSLQNFYRALGPPTPESAKQAVNVPFSTGSQMYRLPSQLEEERRTAEAGRLKAAGAYETAYATAKGRAAGTAAEPTIPVTYPAIADQPSITIDVPRSKYTEAIKALRDLKGDAYAAHSFQTDDKGNVTFVGVPKSGGEPQQIPLGPIGKKRQSFGPAEQAVAVRRARLRVAKEFTGIHRNQLINDYAFGTTSQPGGIYSTLAQQEGITWEDEDLAKVPGSIGQATASRIADLRRRAYAQAKELVDRDLTNLEARYAQEELEGGATASVASINQGQQRRQTALANYRKLTPEQKRQVKNGVTPRQWFIKTFGVDPESLR